MSDWVKVVKEPIEVKELEEDGNDKWMEEEVMKEERLSRMLERKRLWEVWINFLTISSDSKPF